MSSLSRKIQLFLVILLSPIALAATFWAFFLAPDPDEDDDSNLPPQVQKSMEDMRREKEDQRNIDESIKAIRADPKFQERRQSDQMSLRIPGGAPQKKEESSSPTKPKAKPAGIVDLETMSPYQRNDVIRKLMPTLMRELRAKRSILLSDKVTKLPETLHDEMKVIVQQESHYLKLRMNGKISKNAWYVLRHRHVRIGLDGGEGGQGVRIVSIRPHLR